MLCALHKVLVDKLGDGHTSTLEIMLTSEMQARTQGGVALLCALHKVLVDKLGDGHASTLDVRAQLADYGHAGLV